MLHAAGAGGAGKASAAAMTTPVRRQYLEMKAAHPDAILFFRLGDFYETFDEDAEIVSRELGVQLTSKPMGAGVRCPLAGVPAARAEQHVARLVAAGRRVAICEQLEQPGAARGLVRRGVVRVVSPGAALEPALLEEGRPAACAALAPLRAPGGGWTVGVAAADPSTGAFHACQLAAEPAPGDPPPDRAADRAGPPPALWEAAAAELERLGAREALLPEGGPAPPEAARAALPPHARARPAAAFRPAAAARLLRGRFPPLGADPAAALGLDERPAALAAAGAVLDYLAAALPAGAADPSAAGPIADGAPAPAAADPLSHLSPPRLYEPAAVMRWDAAARRALAVDEPGPGPPARPGAPRTLLESVDRCRTAGGRRWLRAALLAPLLDLARIGRRLDRVEALARAPALRRELEPRLAALPDLERLLARAAAGLARPPELAALARGLLDCAGIGAGLAAAGPAQAALALDPPAANGNGSGGSAAAAGNGSAGSAAADPLAALAAALGPAPPAAAALAEALGPGPAADYGGGVVRPGADPAVDAARAAADEARAAVAAVEDELRRESGLPGLRAGRHGAFGWYLEAPRSELKRAAPPAAWQPRQSLRHHQRFAEPRLLEAGAAADAAEAGLAAAERGCVERLRAALAAEAPAVRRAAAAAARLDAAWSLASVAAERGWTRPEPEPGGRLEIEGGRHPIVEAADPGGGFAPNAAALDAAAASAPQLLIVTGPNMAGKSTYLRQAALIAALAQAGSFVPAERARIGLIDRVYARVGAQDDLAAGRSTFLVEMLETARLLRGAGPRSLVLLDEIGRGTGSRDGLAIARAVAEALAGIGPGGAEPPGAPRPRAMFATHFLELTALAGESPRIGNAAALAEPDPGGGVRFPHRIEPGAADRSYGVQVAAQAGLPPAVVDRAAGLLAELERAAGAAGPHPPPPAPCPSAPPAAPAAAELLRDLAAADVDGITPIEAINALYALRDRARAELRGPP